MVQKNKSVENDRGVSKSNLTFQMLEICTKIGLNN